MKSQTLEKPKELREEHCPVTGHTLLVFKGMERVLDNSHVYGTYTSKQKAKAALRAYNLKNGI